MCRTWSIKQGSLPHSQKKPTSHFATQHLKNAIEITHALSRNERYKNVTEPSKYTWSLKDRKINYEIKWRKIRHARWYSHINKKYNLCLREKTFIICKPEKSTLNHRKELTSICRHSKKFLLNILLI